MKKILVLSMVAFFSLSAAALAHSGGTDRYGCHNNHKTGGYHCH